MSVSVDYIHELVIPLRELKHENLVTLLLFSTLVTLILVWFAQMRRRHRLFKTHGIPGPEPAMVSGNLFEMASFHHHKDLTHTITWIKKYGPIVGYYVGTIPYMIVSDLNLISKILVSNFQYFVDRPDMYVDVLPFSVSFPHDKGETWKNRRYQVTPSFSSARIKSMLPKMNEAVDVLFKVLHNSDLNKSVDVLEKFQRMVLDVFVRSIVGVRDDCQTNSKSQLLLSTRSFFVTMDSVLIYLAISIRPLARLMSYCVPFLPSGKTAARANVVFKEVLGTAKRENIKTSIFNRMSHTVLDKSKPQELIPDDFIVNDIHVLMLASYDTASKTLTCVCHLLATHPEVQDEVYKELLQLRENEYALTLSDLDSLKYLDQVICETLRIYPPFPNFVTRYCQEDVTIDGQFFPKGVNIEIPIWYLHHNADLWEDPWKFDPSRFSPENRPKILPMSYLPFGAGQRTCPGMRFAMAEIKLTLVRFLLRYRLERSAETADTVPLRSNWGLINPSGEVNLKLTKRPSFAETSEN